MRSLIGLKGTFTKKKIRPALEKIKETSQETMERFYEQLVKYTHPSTIINNSKSYINKFVKNEGLIYLETRKFGRTTGYSAEWIVKKGSEKRANRK